MLTESEVQQITDKLEKMSYEEVMETLMHVNLLVAEKQNKIVFSGCDHVQ
jgi:hypothetical protein